MEGNCRRDCSCILCRRIQEEIEMDELEDEFLEYLAIYYDEGGEG